MAKPWWKSVKRVEARIREAAPHAVINETDYGFGLEACVGRVVYVAFRPARPDMGSDRPDIAPTSEAEVQEAIERLKAATWDEEGPYIRVGNPLAQDIKPISVAEIGEALKDAIERAAARPRP